MERSATHRTPHDVSRRRGRTSARTSPPLRFPGSWTRCSHAENRVHCLGNLLFHAFLAHPCFSGNFLIAHTVEPMHQEYIARFGLQTRKLYLHAAHHFAA